MAIVQFDNVSRIYTSGDLAGQDGIYKNFITGRKQAVSWKPS